MSIPIVLLNIGLCAALTAFVSAVSVMVPMRLDRGGKQPTAPRAETARLTGTRQAHHQHERQSAA